MKIDKVFKIQNILFSGMYMHVLWINKPIFHEKHNLMFGPFETINCLATFPVKLPTIR